jgi:hypothetical protein
MSQVIDLKEGRLLIAIKKGFRNWESQFGETFGPATRVSHLSLKTLVFLAQGRDMGTFFLYDLIMNLKGFGSGFEFDELDPSKKMAVIDQYLFLLDRMRFECMKRIGLLESYPGEAHSMVELILDFDQVAPRLHAQIPILQSHCPGYEEYTRMNTFDKEVFVRKMIPAALEDIKNSLSH